MFRSCSLTSLVKERKMIAGFFGEYRWLSNFWACEVKAKDGTLFHSVEQAYQWAKFFPGVIRQGDDRSAREAILLCETPAAAKRTARGLQSTVRTDWDDIKLEVMLRLLRQKFAISSLKEKLLATGEEELVEANTWGDVFWGVCNGVGENYLGKLLMQVRNELKQAEENQ